MFHLSSSTVGRLPILMSFTGVFDIVQLFKSESNTIPELLKLFSIIYAPDANPVCVNGHPRIESTCVLSQGIKLSRLVSRIFTTRSTCSLRSPDTMISSREYETVDIVE